MRHTHTSEWTTFSSAPGWSSTYTLNIVKAEYAPKRTEDRKSIVLDPPPNIIHTADQTLTILIAEFPRAPRSIKYTSNVTEGSTFHKNRAQFLNITHTDQDQYLASESTWFWDVLARILRDSQEWQSSKKLIATSTEFAIAVENLKEEWREEAGMQWQCNEEVAEGSFISKEEVEDVPTIKLAAQSTASCCCNKSEALAAAVAVAGWSSLFTIVSQSVRDAAASTLTNRPRRQFCSHTKFIKEN